MSGNDDSFVIVGGRKSLPKVYVENEEKSEGNLRFRHCSTSSPDATRTPATVSPTKEGSSKTPVFGTPTTFTVVTDRRSKTRPSPTLKDLGEGKGKVEVDDSGYCGWKESSNVKKKLRYDPSTNKNGSYIEEEKANGSDSFWEQVSSPVLDMKKKLQGKPSFLDEGRKSNIQPQHILAGIVMLIMISSIGFAVLIGYKHFSNDPDSFFNNGKMRSIKYGTEKKLEALKSEGRLLDRDLMDESGEILGGKRASIQFAHETKVVSEVDKDASLPSWGRPISSRKIIQAANQMDLLELAESIDALSKALETKVHEVKPMSQSKTGEEAIERVYDLRTDEKTANLKENVVVNNIEKFSEDIDNNMKENKAPNDAVVNNIIAGDENDLQERSRNRPSKGLDHQGRQQFRLKKDSEGKRIKREEEHKFRFKG